MSKRTPIKDLYNGALDCKPVDFDFSEGYGEIWEYIQACRCDECNKIVVGGCEGDQHSDVDNESKCSGGLSGEGPMMSYFYPLHIRNTSEAARLLVDTCLCVVTMNDGNTTGLALTGGGMNLSWEICEAFMLLGFLPPLHFADLPGMAGRGSSRSDRWIIAGCLRSCTVAAESVLSTAKRIRETIKRERARTAKPKPPRDNLTPIAKKKLQACPGDQERVRKSLREPLVRGEALERELARLEA